MGNKSSISSEELREYQSKQATLSKKEITKYHTFWHKLYPEGVMTMDNFMLFAEIAMPSLTSPETKSNPAFERSGITEQLFRALDFDGDGRVTFGEFLLFQSITAPLDSFNVNIADLVGCAFDLYDREKRGKIDRTDLERAFEGVFAVKGVDASSDKGRAIISSKIDKLMKMADSDGDGFLTKADIVDVSARDSSLFVLF